MDGWTDEVMSLCDDFTVQKGVELGLDLRADLEKSKDTGVCIPGTE